MTATTQDTERTGTEGTSYRVLQELVFPAKDRFPTAAVYGDLPGAGLRMITCGGTFDRGVRSYTDNVVVLASLVDPGRGPV